MEISAQDICAIVQACKESKVVRLKFGALELEFESQPQRTETSPPIQVPTIAQEIFQEINEADRLANLMMADPLQWEKEMAKIDSGT